MTTEQVRCARVTVPEVPGVLSQRRRAGHGHAIADIQRPTA